MPFGRRCRAAADEGSLSEGVRETTAKIFARKWDILGHCPVLASVRATTLLARRIQRTSTAWTGRAAQTRPSLLSVYDMTADFIGTAATVNLGTETGPLPEFTEPDEKTRWF